MEGERKWTDQEEKKIREGRREGVREWGGKAYLGLVGREGGMQAIVLHCFRGPFDDEEGTGGYTAVGGDENL